MAPNRVALVTGASRGLGARIASRLSADGWAVAVNYRAGRAAADRVVEAIHEAGGVAHAFGADVLDEAEVTSLVGQVERHLGPVVAIVANATGPQPAAGLEELTWQAQLDQLEFFVKSPTLLVQEVLPGMKQRGGGRIINIGSDIVERVVPGMSAYAAAKAAQLELTRTWARELGAFGITVNLVAPGWVPVERHADAPPEALAAYRANVALGRLGVPADVAAAVAFLASPRAAHINGVVLEIDGGQTRGMH